MKKLATNWLIGTQNLVPLIAAGQLCSQATEPLIHGTYLEAWFRCLKFSKEFTESSRTGIFTSEDAYKTFCMFGALENVNYREWWLCKGHEYFSESITSLNVSVFSQRKNSKVIAFQVDARREVSNELTAREFGFWLNQICLLNEKQGLLSQAPLTWPIFKSRISCEAISQLLSLMEEHDQIIRHAPGTTLWQIGEQLKLNPRAMPKASDCERDVAEKHKSMGQTVSNYLRKGNGLVRNACNGIFPRYV